MGEQDYSQQVEKLRAIFRNANLPLAQRRAAKDKYNAIVEKLTKVVEAAKPTYPHLFFKPNPPQARFLKMMNAAVRERGVFDLAALWGTWTGKTTLLVNTAWNLTQPSDLQAPCFRELDIFQHWGVYNKDGKFVPFPKRIRLGVTSAGMKEMGGEVWTQIQNWWPKDGSWKYQKQGLDYPSAFQLPNGWLMDVMAFDRAAEVKESVSLGLYITDEPPPVSDWIAAAGRRKEGGLRIMFGSLVLDSQGMFDEITQNSKCEYFYASTRENYRSVGGYLDDDITEQMIQALPRAEREYRVSGKPRHFRGKAFDINPDKHFVKLSQVPKVGLTCVVVDPHPRKPYFIGVYRRDEYGNIYMVDEWPTPMDCEGDWFHKVEKDMRGVGFFAGQIKRLAAKWDSDFLVLDYRFANAQVREDDWAVSTLNKLRDSYGLEFEKGSMQVSGDGGAIRELQDALEFENDRPPRMRIVKENCPNAAYLLENVGWVEDREKLDPKMDDGARNMMYAVMAPWDNYTPFKIPAHESGRSWEEIELENKVIEGWEERRRSRAGFDADRIFATAGD